MAASSWFFPKPSRLQLAVEYIIFTAHGLSLRSKSHKVRGIMTAKSAPADDFREMRDRSDSQIGCVCQPIMTE
jgi:hypothetical protein